MAALGLEGRTRGQGEWSSMRLARKSTHARRSTWNRTVSVRASSSVRCSRQHRLQRACERSRSTCSCHRPGDATVGPASVSARRHLERRSERRRWVHQQAGTERSSFNFSAHRPQPMLSHERSGCHPARRGQTPPPPLADSARRRCPRPPQSPPPAENGAARQQDDARGAGNGERETTRRLTPFDSTK